MTRYGYQIVNSEERLKTPLIKKEGKQVKASWVEAIDYINKRINEIKSKMGSVCIGGLASPQLDNLSLHSFSKFIRTVLKSNNIDFRGDYRRLPDDPDTPFGVLRSQPFSIKDIDDSDVVIVFGSDLIKEHPNEYLRIRKANNFNQSKIFSLNPYVVKTADIANLEIVYRPGTDESVINGIALAAIEEGLIEKSISEEYLFRVVPSTLDDCAKLCGVEAEDLKIIAHAINEGKKISFIVGEIATRSHERDLISASLLNLNKLFDIVSNGQIAILARYVNSKGAEKLGLLPKTIPAIKETLKNLWGEYPDCDPKTTDAMMAQIKKEEIKGFFIFGSNPIMLYPDREFVSDALEKLDFLVVADMFETATTELADVVLPLCSWAEFDGSYTNLEGMTQTAYKAIEPLHESKPPSIMIREIAESLDAKGFDKETLNKEITELLNSNSTQPLPDQFIDIKPESTEPDNKYPYPMFIVDDPHHCGHLTEKSKSLNSFVGESYVEISPELASRLDIFEEDLVRIESEINKIVVSVKISKYLDSNVVLIPRNFSTVPVNSLMMRKKRLDFVKITKVEE